MRIVVSGATGVLGRSVVPLLLKSSHQVIALSRSGETDARVVKTGAQPARADLFDRDSLFRALAGADAVLHLATRIPPPDKAGKRDAWLENDRIRSEGTRNLIDAALSNGVATFIYPGVVFVYPDRGADWIDASTPPDASGLLQSSLDAEREVARFTQAGRRGVVLRMGAFYGPASQNSRETMAWARRGMAMFFGRADAYQPLIWIDDAAAAVAAALESAPAGIYDIVDDASLTRSELAAALASAVGRRRLIRPPAFMLKLLLGRNAGFLTRSQRVSNRRFRDATGWRPSVPSAREGLQLLRSIPIRGAGESAS